MLYWITQQFVGRISGAHVFAYLTFRAILATSSALWLSLLIGPPMIARLSRYQIGQVVRDDGPPTHLLKAGTPTMGGTLILVTTLVSTLLWAELSNRLVWTVLGVTFAFGLIGFYDDYRPCLVKENGVIDIMEDVQHLPWGDSPQLLMEKIIINWDTLRPRLQDRWNAARPTKSVNLYWPVISTPLMFLLGEVPRCSKL